MTLTTEQVVEIITETVEKTAKDMNHLSDMIQMVAAVALEVGEILANDHDASPEMTMKNRAMTKEHALAWKTIVKLKES
jgi:hypothetical protein